MKTLAPAILISIALVAAALILKPDGGRYTLHQWEEGGGIMYHLIVLDTKTGAHYRVHHGLPEGMPISGKSAVSKQR